eukprot:m.9181 g.9181  ORF g.9181 m.9181 type:complete len:199 (-) comp6850_c0_seq1:326-922(-)
MSAFVFGIFPYARYDYFEYRGRSFHVSQQMCHVCFIPLFPVQELLYLDKKAKKRLECCTPKGVYLSYCCLGIPTCSRQIEVSDDERLKYLISKADTCFTVSSASLIAKMNSQNSQNLYVPPGPTANCVPNVNNTETNATLSPTALKADVGQDVHKPETAMSSDIIDSEDISETTLGRSERSVHDDNIQHAGTLSEPLL